MILSQFWPQTADLAKCACPDGVMGADAQRSKPGRISGLQRSMGSGFRKQSSANRPTPLRIRIADARRGDIPDTRVCERPDHLLQIVDSGPVIGIHLDHEIIILVAIMIVEVGEVSLLAASPARPCKTMIIRNTLSTGDVDAVFPAPSDRFLAWIFIGQPRVVGMILGERRFERLLH